MKPILQVKGLTVRFGGVRAVDDVTFELQRGQILGVIGPNGAGKTTMFDAISGFVPSTGRVMLDRTEISELAPEGRSRQGLGRSFQDARLFPSLTVVETLAVAFERHLKKQDIVSTALKLPWVRKSEVETKRRVEGLIELMGLGAFRDKFIGELSTGSRRIVDLAVIMAHDPKVLLLDEPSSGIAQKETEALGPLLLSLREETDCSMIVVEHDMPLIQNISDELLALETGAVLLKGPPAEVIADPRLVASYLGSDQSTISRSGSVAPAKKPVKATKATAKAQAEDTETLETVDADTIAEVVADTLATASVDLVHDGAWEVPAAAPKRTRTLTANRTPAAKRLTSTNTPPVRTPKKPATRSAPTARAATKAVGSRSTTPARVAVPSKSNGAKRVAVASKSSSTRARTAKPTRRSGR